MNQGDKVYVRWYGKVLEGSVVNTDDLFGLTAVRIPIQGAHATALFRSGSISATPPPCLSMQAPRASQDERQAFQPSGFSVIESFKRDHWDNDRNHLRIDALDDFYRLFRDYMAMRSNMMKATIQANHMTIEAPATPAEAFRDGPRPFMPAPRAGHNNDARPSMPAPRAGSPITYHKPVKHQTTQLSLW